MTIKIGDTLPAGVLAEFIESATEGCALGPNTFQVADLVKGKTIAIFGLPGAYTPTCSAQHVPGYVQHAAALAAKGVNETDLEKAMYEEIEKTRKFLAKNNFFRHLAD